MPAHALTLLAPLFGFPKPYRDIKAFEAELAAILASELRGRGSCLEIGVGTGRMAIPLQRHGIDMYGVDISVAMLTELLRKGAAGPLPWVSIAAPYGWACKN